MNGARHLGDAHKGIRLSDEHRKKLSDSLKGREFSEETRAKISANNVGFKGKKHTEASRKKMSKSQRGKKRSITTRKKISDAMTFAVISGKRIPGTRGEWGHFISNKNNGVSLYYQSSYELRAFEILEQDPLVMCYVPHPFSISYIFNGIEKRYIPDLLISYISGDQLLMEVKARWEINTPRNLVKFAAAQLYCQEHGLVFSVWTEKDLGL